MLIILFVFGSLAGVLVLALAIPRVVRLVRTSVLFRGPLVAEQNFQLEEPGSFVMHAEAPLGSTFMRGNTSAPPPAFRGLKYTIRNATSGVDVPLGGVFTVASTSGFKKTRRPLKSFKLNQPGEFTLSVKNLAPETDTKDCSFVLTRSYGLAMPLFILMIVAGGLLFISGTILTILRLSGVL